MNRTYILLLLLVWLSPVANGQAGDPLCLTEARRILFLGNSITHAGHYVSLFEYYLLSKNPKSTIEVINMALPSETVSGLSEVGHADGLFNRPCLFSRLDSVVKLVKPDIVIACYGMNDGIYQPFNTPYFKRYQEGMRALHSHLKASQVKRIIFMTPSIHQDPKCGFRGYNTVLDRYACWLKNQRTELAWEVIDIHFPMLAYVQHKQRDDLEFTFAEDGVHPNLSGHKFIAQQLIQYFDQTWAVESLLTDCLTPASIHNKVFQLIHQRQELLRDAWLDHVGHERPGLSVGLPLKEAQQKSLQIKYKIERSWDQLTFTE